MPAVSENGFFRYLGSDRLRLSRVHPRSLLVVCSDSDSDDVIKSSLQRLTLVPWTGLRSEARVCRKAQPLGNKLNADARKSDVCADLPCDAVFRIDLNQPLSMLRGILIHVGLYVSHLKFSTERTCLLTIGPSQQGNLEPSRADHQNAWLRDVPVIVIRGPAAFAEEFLLREPYEERPPPLPEYRGVEWPNLRPAYWGMAPLTRSTSTRAVEE
ncbi:hypothetical protein DFH08DRAFT_807156 [Mycena albidolilacea]|uniref:Uncharacterized protein n=1 Tax=Mycena albidolilacea TaxID=1033008 RepID=A0AAD7ESY4_9AGAR|nr:hypothetical protein DFH08DRAFT_807156 [Mycena albidolilacea]